MKRRLLVYGTICLLLVSMLEGCAVINTRISLKYETEQSYSPAPCISAVTGTDLCAALRLHKTLAEGSFAGFIALLIGAALIDQKEKNS